MTSSQHAYEVRPRKDKTWRRSLLRTNGELLDNRPDARGTLTVAKSRRVHAPLKREESVRAEHDLIFVAVVEDCLARVVVTDLRSKK